MKKCAPHLTTVDGLSPIFALPTVSNDRSAHRHILLLTLSIG